MKHFLLAPHMFIKYWTIDNSVLFSMLAWLFLTWWNTSLPGTASWRWAARHHPQDHTTLLWLQLHAQNDPSRNPHRHSVVARMSLPSTSAVGAWICDTHIAASFLWRLVRLSVCVSTPQAEIHAVGLACCKRITRLDYVQGQLCPVPPPYFGLVLSLLLFPTDLLSLVVPSLRREYCGRPFPSCGITFLSLKLRALINTDQWGWWLNSMVNLTQVGRGNLF